MDAKTKAAIEQLKRDPERARRLLLSPDGQALMNMLSAGDNGAKLRAAVQSAARGNTQELSQMLGALMKDRGAAAMMSRLNDAAR